MRELAEVPAAVTRDPRAAELLAVEKALAERTQRGFAWILVHGGDRAGLARTVRAAQDSLRASDRVRELVDGSLLVVFPATPHAAACQAFQRALESSGAAEVELESGTFDPPLAPLAAVDRSAGPIDRPRLPGIRWERRGVAVLLARPLPRWKRVTDVIVSGLGIALTLPVMLLVALGIKLTSPGPILFQQWRTGQLFRRFRIHKFRTMKPCSEGAWGELQHLNQMSGPLFKSDNDPRIYPFGKFLRKTSLDELPQLFNVLKGDMTLIGPRALSPEPAQYEPWQLRRFDVVPGLACTWQAFRRGETNFEEWMRSDLAWIDRNAGPLEDLRLLLATGMAVVRCAGGR